jgi:hypothetical protein
MQSNLLGNLSLKQLKQAVAIRQRIGGLEKELDRIVGGQSPSTRNAAPRRKRRLSAAGRAKLSAVMKARWANRWKRKSLRVAKAGRPAAAKMNSRPKSGRLKDQIIRKLKAAGNRGLAVKDLAAKLGRSYGSISVWFHTTAKAMKEIQSHPTENEKVLA